MRTSVALSAALAGLFLAPLASAESATSAAPNPSAAPSAPASSAAPAPPPGTAATPQAPELVVVPAEPDQPPLEPIANARDTLGGHFVLGAAAGVSWPFGSHSRGLGTGGALNLDLGFGLSRNVVLGAWGEFDSYSATSDCSGCSGKSFAGGPFLRYHLVQGTRFDPWGAIAVGVRSSSVDTGSSEQYVGPELVKLTLGGDWYPTSKIAVGPYVTFGVGTYGSSAYSNLGTGLRLVLDLPGK